MQFSQKDFDIGKIRVYHGPNMYLNSRALVFNIFLEPEGPDSKYYKNFVYSVLPHIALYNPSTVIDLFSRTIQHLLQFEHRISPAEYSVSEENQDYVVAIEYFDPDITREIVTLSAEWFQAMNQKKKFSFLSEFEKLKKKFNYSSYGCSSVISLIESSSKLGIPLFFPFSKSDMNLGYGQNSTRARCMHAGDSMNGACKCHLEFYSKETAPLNFIDPPENLIFLLKSIFRQKKSARIPIIAANALSKEQSALLTTWIRHINPRYNVAGVNHNQVFFNQTVFSKQEQHWEDIRWILQSSGVSFAIFEHTPQSVYHSGYYHHGADLLLLDTKKECPDGFFNLLNKNALLVEIHKDNFIIIQNQKIIHTIHKKNPGDSLEDILPFLETYFEHLAEKYL